MYALIAYKVDREPAAAIFNNFGLGSVNYREAGSRTSLVTLLYTSNLHYKLQLTRLNLLLTSFRVSVNVV